MSNSFRNFKAAVLLSAVFSLFSATAALGGAQDRVTVDQQIRFARGSNSARISKQILRGTSHTYRVPARAGQEMAVVLKTGSRTSFTITSNSTGILEGADGVRRTLVELPETDEYEIQIGTDANASYTLEVTIH